MPADVPAPLYVFGAVRSKEQARELREVFGAAGRTVHPCEASGHTPGQVIHGDAVVIGVGVALTMEQDATGTVRRFRSVDEARAATSLSVKTVPELREEAQERGVELPSGARKAAIVEALEEADAATEPGAGPASEPAEDEGDELDGMNRVQLIQHAAKLHPGARQWATMSNEALRETLREMGA